MTDTKNTRRAFLKHFAVTAGSLPILSRILVDTAEAQATKPLDEANPTARALGYVHDASKVDKAKFPKKAGPNGDKQLCSNCMFYNTGGQKIEGQPGEWGKCTIFPQGLVAANGWCNSWAIKPGVTL